MKFTLNWLKDHLDTTATLQEVSEALTAIGLEVEAVIDRGAALAPFTVAHIDATAQHPNADKLRVCTVNTGKEILSIVCGAANARPGIKVVLAREGMRIPANGMVLKKSSIRGVDSNGMLCSAEELGLADASEGILELAADAPLGASVVEVLGLGDPVLDIAITPNRGDCLGVRGIARDLAAYGIGTLKPLPQGAVAGATPSPIQVKIADGKDCPRFIGCTIDGVRNTQSPAWMVERLAAIGQKSISPLVDITNYVAIDLGRPLHVYDAAKLTGHLTVRRAHAGETLRALNGKDYTLDTSMIVIADEAGALGLGGVIGGEPSGVSADTTRVFLEVALFDPATIAHAGRTLAIDSDARYRFERHVDPGFIEEGAAQALHLITSLCGGEASAWVDAKAVDAQAAKAPQPITFNPARVAALGGVAIPEARMRDILARLGFVVEASASAQEWLVTPPTARPDMVDNADIVEEIVRIHGYSHIPVSPLPPHANLAKPALDLAQRRAALTRRVLATQGLHELCSWGFVSEAEAAAFGNTLSDATGKALRLKNPISSELAVMRPSLLPHLLSAVTRNAARGFKSVEVFEVGPVFRDATPTGQTTVAAALRAGLAEEKTVHSAARAVDMYDAKADAWALLGEFGINTKQLQLKTASEFPWYHPGRSAVITLGGKIVLGVFGELHPRTLKQAGIEGRAAACEIFLHALPMPKAKTSKAKPLLKLIDFQAVERDFAFVVEASLPVADLLKAAEGADKTLITQVQCFDVYQGKGVAEGKKSLALRVTLQAADRTLTDAEIEAVAQKIIAAANALGATLR